MGARRGILAAAFVALAMRPASAAAPPVRTTGFAVRGGALVASVGAQDVLHGLEPRRLTSGTAVRVLIQAALLREGAPRPVSVASRHAEIVYDVWDERFYVYLGAPGVAPQVQSFGDVGAAIFAATALVRFPVASAAALTPGASYRLQVEAALNPLAPEVVAEVRRWLAPRPGQGRTAPGDAFFGSFVSIFVNPRVEESERVVEFQSQPFRFEAAR